MNWPSLSPQESIRIIFLRFRKTFQVLINHSTLRAGGKFNPELLKAGSCLEFSAHRDETLRDMNG